MKKSYIYLLLILFVSTTSCRDSYDDYVEDRGETIGFTTLPLEAALPPGGSINGFPLTFFVTSVSASDRTFELRIVEEETTLTADNYTIETTVTVPANERKGSLLFFATNNSISTSEYQDLIIEFVATDGISSGKKARVSLISN